MKKLGISEVRQELPNLVDQVVKCKESFLITRHGKVVAQIVPAEISRKKDQFRPLRGMPIKVSADFDDSTEKFWDALNE